MHDHSSPNRDKQHGGLEAVGITSQMIKNALREGINWREQTMHPAAKEALDLIAHKISRVLSGCDPHDFQHWEDIAGYATAFMRTWSELKQEEDIEEDQVANGIRYDPDDYMASGCPDGFCPMPNVRQGPSESMFPPIASD